jgi:hypothetical protein
MLKSMTDLAKRDEAVTQFALMERQSILAVDSARQQVLDHESIVTAAMNQQIHPSTFAGEDINDFVNILQEEASARHLTALVIRPSDIMQAPTSFIMTPTGMDLFIHVPAAPGGSFLSIYRFRPLPIPIHDKFHALIDLETPILAVSEDNELFRTLTPADLAACRQVGDFFKCDRLNVMRRAPNRAASPGRDDALCLFSLFLQKFDDAAKVCHISLARAPDTVQQMDEATFMAYSPDSHVGYIRCHEHPLRDKTKETPNTFKIDADSYTTVKLEPGCVASSDSHQFARPDDDRVREWTVAYPVPLDFDLMPHLNLDRLHEITTQAEHWLANRTKFSLTEATTASDKDAESWLSNGTSAVTGTTWLILLACIVAIITIAVKMCKTGKATAAHAPVPVVVNQSFNQNHAPSAPPIRTKSLAPCPPGFGLIR